MDALNDTATKLNMLCNDFKQKWFKLVYMSEHPRAKSVPTNIPINYDIKKKLGIQYIGSLSSESELKDIAGKILSLLNNLRENGINVGFFRTDLTDWKKKLQEIIDHNPNNAQIIPQQVTVPDHFDPGLQTLFHIPMQGSLVVPSDEPKVQEQKKRKKNEDSDEDEDEPKPKYKKKKIVKEGETKEEIEFEIEEVEPKPFEIQTKPQKSVTEAFEKQPNSIQGIIVPCIIETPFDKAYKFLNRELLKKSNIKTYYNEHKLNKIEFALICCARAAVVLWKEEIEKDIFYKEIHDPFVIGTALHARAEALLSRLLEDRNNKFEVWRGFILIEPVYFPFNGTGRAIYQSTEGGQHVNYPKTTKTESIKQRGSLQPDIVILKADAQSKEDVEAIFDFKFTTDVYKQDVWIPGWDEYKSGSPYNGRNQKNVYCQYFNLQNDLVIRIHQTGPHK